MSSWGEFKVGDLFERVKTKKVPFKALDLPQESNSVQSLPLVAAGIDSQGRNRYIEPKYATILQNCLTVSANGANSGAVFYQNSEFSILQDAYALQLVNDYKNYRKQNVYLYLASVLTNVLVNNDWTNKATWRKVQEKNIKLPITSDGKPNWQYMDTYIAKLAARAHENVSSLNRVKLKRHWMNIDKWKEFKVGDLFVKVAGGSNGAKLNAYISDEQDEVFSLPLIGAKKGNNGIVHYGDPNKFNSYCKCVGIIQDGAASAGLVYPEYDEFGIYNNAYAIELRDHEMTNEELLYLAAILRKSIFDKYSYDYKCTWDHVKNDNIKLPVDANDNIDWHMIRGSVRHLVALSQQNVTLLRSVAGM